MANTTYFSKVMKRVFGASPETIKKMVNIIKSDGSGSAIVDGNVRSALSSDQRRQLDLLLRADSKEEKKMNPDEKKASKESDKEVKESIGSFSQFLLKEAEAAANGVDVTINTADPDAFRKLKKAQSQPETRVLRQQLRDARESLSKETDRTKRMEIQARIRRINDQMKGGPTQQTQGTV